MPDDDDITCELEAVLAQRDAAELTRVLATVWSVGLSVKWAPVFAKLLVERWHFQQEDLANALQDLRDPSTADALLVVALDSAPYDEIDDGRALARKCVWALHDIGARAELEQIATTAKDEETRERAADKLAALIARPAGSPPAAYRVARGSRVRR